MFTGKDDARAAARDRVGRAVREAELHIGIARAFDLFTEADRERCRKVGEYVARYVLCSMLDRLGGDGTTAFLNCEPVADLEDGIWEHIRESERSAVECEEARMADVAARTGDEGRAGERKAILAFIRRFYGGGTAMAIADAVESGQHLTNREPRCVDCAGEHHVLLKTQPPNGTCAECGAGGLMFGSNEEGAS